MIQIDGLWWPNADIRGRPAMLREVKTAVPWVLEHVEGRDCIVQAGGNVGVYALELAKHFQQVVTFEADGGNVDCLIENVGPEIDIRFYACALGSEDGVGSTFNPEPDNCGAVQMTEGGEVRIRPLDWVNLWDCDAIWLDLEGSEYFALQGARKTIDRFHPILILERKGLERTYGIEPETLDALIAEMGYTQVSRHGNDRLYK